MSHKERRRINFPRCKRGPGRMWKKTLISSIIGVLEILKNPWKKLCKLA